MIVNECKDYHINIQVRFYRMVLLCTIHDCSQLGSKCIQLLTVTSPTFLNPD